MTAEYAAEQNMQKLSASDAAKKVEMIYVAQKENLESLNDMLERTETLLEHAKQLFAERAYTPFWDSIEDAVGLLRQFDNRVSYIDKSAKEYYEILDGREHTFPAFPLKSDDLPNPDALLKLLAQIIAGAQRDFQFASIFEQRRTTSAIVTGFRNTQEAIASLQNHIG